MTASGPTSASTSLSREILLVSLPALGALAADPLVSLVDTAFVGRLGPDALGALGINTAVFNLAFFVFNFLAYGTTPLVARAVGAGRPERASRLVTTALWLAVGLGLASTLILQVAAPWILEAMGATGSVAISAMVYLRIRSIAAPAVLLVTVGHGAFRGFQDTRTPLRVSMGISVANLILDPLLIFGLGWGVAGAAVATAAAQWIGALWFLFILFRRAGVLPTQPAGDGETRVHIPPFARPHRDELLQLLRAGNLLVVRTLALMPTFTLATAVAARMGTAQVAAHLIASQLWLFLALVIDALAIAGQAMVGLRMGRGQREDARDVAQRLFVWGAGLGATLAALFWMLRGTLPLLFTPDPQVIETTRALMPFVAVMQPVNALVFVADGVFIGALDFRYLAASMVLSAGVASTLLLLALPLGWGIEGVWWAMVSLMGVRFVTLAWRFCAPAGPLGSSASPPPTP